MQATHRTQVRRLYNLWNLYIGFVLSEHLLFSASNLDFNVDTIDNDRQSSFIHYHVGDYIVDLSILCTVDQYYSNINIM